MLPSNACSRSQSIKQTCRHTAPCHKNVYGNTRTNCGMNPTNGSVWESRVLGHIVADFKFGVKLLKKTCRIQRREKRLSWPNSALCPHFFWLNWWLKVLSGSQDWDLFGTCQWCYAQVQESNRIKTSCIASADVIIDSNCFCIVFVILMGTVSCKVLNTFCSELSGTVFYVVCAPTACCFQQESRRSNDFYLSARGLQRSARSCSRCGLTHHIVSCALGLQSIPC